MLCFRVSESLEQVQSAAGSVGADEPTLVAGLYFAQCLLPCCLAVVCTCEPGLRVCKVSASSECCLKVHKSQNSKCLLPSVVAFPLSLSY